jgi:hypothetical protein
MRRLAGLLALAALSLPASAGAKEFTALRLCGANGCHSTRDKQAMLDAMSVQPQASPGHGGAFYRLRFTIGGAGMPREGFVRSQWIPSLGLIRNADGPLVEFSLPYPGTARMLRRLTRDLRPLPAARLGRLNGGPSDARVSETVPAPKPTRQGGGGSKGWMWSGLAILPAVIAFFLQRRRRRTPSPASLP